jgi:hypothetical protein
METKEETRSALLRKAETCMENLVLSLQKMDEGDLQELEREIMVQVLALGRSCLEEVLEGQAKQKESAIDKESACGHRQRLVSKRPRQVLSLLGQITIHRGYYHCVETGEQAEERKESVCRKGEVPFDRAWGLSCGQRSSPGVQRVVSYLSANLTHEEVAEALCRVLPLGLSARQVGNILQPIGEAFEQGEDQQVREIVEQGATKDTSEVERQEEQGEPLKHLYVEMDGVMARLRRGSVPMERQEQERSGDVYREVKVGAVFEGEPGHERSKLVPGVFVDTPGPIRYVARRTTAEDFAPRIYALAHAAGVVRAKQVVILADGAKWIWRLAEEQFPGAVQIVDEYHAREHIWEVARAAFAGQPSERDTWAKTVTDLLAEGQVEQVITAIERLPHLEPEPNKARSLPEIEAEYFRTNAERMRYPSFRAQGMHVGSGIAEAACKTVVATRAKRSGMRWTPAGLDAILALRTAVLNKDFDRRWQASRKVA